MSKFSVVIFRDDPGSSAQPFLASRDPEVVRGVAQVINKSLNESLTHVAREKSRPAKFFAPAVKPE